MFLVNSLRVGGSERKAIRLANALAASNQAVVLAYLSPPESLLSQVHAGVTVLNLGRRGKFSLRALRRLGAVIDAHDVGTLIAINLYSALYSVLVRTVCQNRSLRVVASVNTTCFVTLKEELQMLVYGPVLRRVDLIVFGAELQRRLWCSRYALDGRPERTTVLYNGVDAAVFGKERVVPARLDEPAGRLLLGTVGALRVEKAQVDLVRAVHEMAERGVDVAAVIVGEGPERPELEREIRRLGVGRKVHLVGETNDVRPYLALMDIFVLPSIAVETFSNAALEAMAMGRPVLVAQVGGMEEMVQFGGGIMYPPGDVKSLCDVLMPLVVNAEARKELGVQARRAAEQHFSFVRMLSDFRSRVLDQN